ncbi:MAG: MBL fold metallo-hydrolase [Myxococcota bacterium]
MQLNRAFGTLLFVAGCAQSVPPGQTVSPRRLGMEAMVQADPAGEPRLLFLLLGHYGATGRQREGLAFFEAVLNHAGSDSSSSRLDPSTRALYLSVIGALRVQMASEIRLLRRVTWVNRGLAELDEAVESTDGALYVVRWLRGVILAQLPPRFDRAKQARRELAWLQAHLSDAPVPGLAREVFFQRARLLREEDPAQAALLLERSGYHSLDRSRAFNTSFTLNPETGFTFQEPEIRELVPGRVYQAPGFDFMEYQFVVSADRSSLIAIDAGARAEAAAQAEAALRQAYPNLPPVTDVLVTHAHWDHVGGHRHFRQAVFHGSANGTEQLARQEGSGGPYHYWWGADFDLAAVTSYRSDRTYGARTRISIGETPIDIVPVPGGETRDALLFYFPQEGVLFTGDMIMPYLGAPHAQEGDPRALLQSIQIAESLRPVQVLHGHQGIHRLFPTPAALFAIREPLAWLAGETERRLASAEAPADILHANLIPADLPANLRVPYLVIREHLIKRIADERQGYWREPYAGGDTLTDRELGSVLTHYLGLDRSAQIALVERMLAAGDHELALRTLLQLLPHAPANRSLLRLKRETLTALADRNQNLDAFKFLWFGQGAGITLGPIGEETIDDGPPSMNERVNAGRDERAL